MRTSFDVDLNVGSYPGQDRGNYLILVSLCRVSELVELVFPD